MTPLRRTVRALRRLPFTLALVAVLGALVLAASGPGFTAKPEVVARWGFALHKLWEGRVWTLVSATFLLHRPFFFPVSAAFVFASVGVYEWTAGTRRAVAVFWAADLGGSLVVALAVVLPLYLAGTAVGSDLAFADDVGVSGGAFACLGAWMGRLPDRRRGLPLRRLVLAAAALYLVANLLVPGALEADLLHAVVFPLGIALDRALAREPLADALRQRDRERRR